MFITEMSSRQPEVGGPSPWGPIQSLKVYADGIVAVSTASHGGIWVSPEREVKIPTYLRRAARQYAPVQWYEEDCDCCVVAVTFPDELPADFVNHARAYLSVDPRYQPDAR